MMLARVILIDLLACHLPSGDHQKPLSGLRYPVLIALHNLPTDGVAEGGERVNEEREPLLVSREQSFGFFNGDDSRLQCFHQLPNGG